VSGTPSQRPSSVLVIDDNPHVLAVLAAGLPQFGVTALTAASGAEAVALLQARRPWVGLALLDVAMPGMDGPDTLLALRAVEPGLRCWFMTGGPGGYTTEGLLALGAERVVLKPFVLSRLAAELGRALRPVGAPAGG
jgi:two-component system, OmpR family, response regulator